MSGESRFTESRNDLSRGEVLFVLGVAVLVWAGGCAATGVAELPARFDDLCIAGRLTEESAAELNLWTDSWKQHGDYAQPLKAGDRLLNGDCSEVSKRALSGDLEGALEALEEVLGAGG